MLILNTNSDIIIMRGERLNKVKEILVYVVVITLILGFFAIKAIKTSEKISTVSKQAIEYAQNLYVGKNFDMVSWNYNRGYQSYTVTLINTDNKTSLLYCEVFPEFQYNKFHVEIYGGRNMELLEEKNLNPNQGRNQRDGSAAR